MKRIPRFRSKQAEADFWMRHDTTDYWNSFEEMETPLQVAEELMESIRARHERTKLVSLRLYPSQLRLARSLSKRKGIPYQTLLRYLIERGLSQMEIKRAA